MQDCEQLEKLEDVYGLRCVLAHLLEHDHQVEFAYAALFRKKLAAAETVDELVLGQFEQALCQKQVKTTDVLNLLVDYEV